MLLPDETNWLNIKIAIWKAMGVKLNAPAKEEMIIKAQNELSFQFPNDFKDFYKKANGFVEWDFIGSMFSIWSLEKIVREFKSSDDKSFIPFCDHSIDLYRIGYLNFEEGVFNDFNQEKPIAKTFEDTLRLIVKDSAILYGHN